MARWDDELQDHAARLTVNQLARALKDAPTPETPEALDELQRVTQIVGMLQEAMDVADASLIRNQANQLDLIQKQAAAAAAQLANYVSNENAAHITQMIPSAEALLQNLQVLRVATPLPDASVGEAANEYRLMVSHYARQIRDKAEEASQKVGSLSEAVAKAQADVAKLHTDFDQKLVGWEDRFGKAETKRQTDFEKRTSDKIAEAEVQFVEEVSSFKGMYLRQNESLEAQQTEQQGKFSKHENDWQAQVKGLEERTAGIVAALGRYKTQAEALTGKISEAGLSGRYLEASKSEMWAARGWYTLGILLALGLVAGAWWLLFVDVPPPADFSLPDSIRRAIFILVGSAPPLFALRQATEHRHAARVYRRLHVELASFGLYLADLDPDEQAKQKINRVPHYFPGRKYLLDKPGEMKAYRGSLVSDLFPRRGARKPDADT